METNFLIDNATLTCYNNKKRGDCEMSLVIMIKCADGIVCGADSNSTLHVTYCQNVGDVKKVFKNNSLIIGQYGVNSFLHREGAFLKNRVITDFIDEILASVNTIEDFCKAICQLVRESSNTAFTFFVGYEGTLFNCVIQNNAYTITENNTNFLSNSTYFGYQNTITENIITIEEGKRVLEKMINLNKELQAIFLKHPVVGGEIRILDLKK